jgi:hypothetical protein
MYPSNRWRRAQEVSRVNYIKKSGVLIGRWSRHSLGECALLEDSCNARQAKILRFANFPRFGRSLPGARGVPDATINGGLTMRAHHAACAAEQGFARNLRRRCPHDGAAQCRIEKLSGIYRSQAGPRACSTQPRGSSDSPPSRPNSRRRSARTRRRASKIWSGAAEK